MRLNLFSLTVRQPLGSYSLPPYYTRKQGTIIKDTEHMKWIITQCQLHAQKGTSHLVIMGSETKHFRNTSLELRTIEMIPESIVLLNKRVRRKVIRWETESDHGAWYPHRFSILMTLLTSLHPAGLFFSCAHAAPFDSSVGRAEDCSLALHVDCMTVILRSLVQIRLEGIFILVKLLLLTPISFDAFYPTGPG